jgi:hypothetical protein
MRQRVPRRSWQRAGSPLVGRRPRILIEDDGPALAISDFSEFWQAGFDVAFCSGPGADQASCPLLHGQQCEVLAGADAVLHGLDPGLGVAASIRCQLPGTPMVIKQRRLADGSVQSVPAGCLPLVPDCSVRGQIEALWMAAGVPGD